MPADWPGSWLDREPFSPLQLEMLGAGARRAFAKPWSTLLKDLGRPPLTGSVE